MKVRIGHAPAVVVIEDRSAGPTIVSERPRWRDRFSARWWSRPLDRALAAGTPPEASAALALRAHRLTELAERMSIADALRQVLCEAPDDRRTSTVRITPSRAAVQDAGEELWVLAETLADPGPVAAQGVAQAELLLTDGTGPLYNPRRRPGLRETAARAASRLRPWPA